MDPLSALSIATGVITFVDFGSKLISLYLQAQEPDDDRRATLRKLETELREVSNNASHARQKCADLLTRYPHQSELLEQLSAECTLVELELQSLADRLTAKPDLSLRALSSQALGSIRGTRKKDDFNDLQGRLRGIRERTMMSVIMCLLFVFLLLVLSSSSPRPRLIVPAARMPKTLARSLAALMVALRKSSTLFAP